MEIWKNEFSKEEYIQNHENEPSKVGEISQIEFQYSLKQLKGKNFTNSDLLNLFKLLGEKNGKISLENFLQ